MKKFFGCLILGLLISAAVAQEPCLVSYRRDLMERWVAPAGSSLCSINRPSDKENQYGLTYDKGLMRITSKDLNTEFFDNYISEKGGQYNYSISVYRPMLDYAHFVTIVETDQASKRNNVEYTFRDDASAHYRSTHFIGPGELKREGTELRRILIWVLCILEGFLIIHALFRSTSRMGCAFQFILLVGISLCTGWWAFYSTFWFIVTFIIVIVLAFAVGFSLERFGPRLISVILGILLIIYYYFGGAYENRWFFWIALILIVIEAAVFGYGRTHLIGADKGLYVAQSAVFWTTVYLFWSYIFVIYPPEIYFRFFKGPKDYKSGVIGRGFTLWWWSLVTLIGVLILAAIAGVLRRGRDARRPNVAVAENNKFL